LVAFWLNLGAGVFGFAYLGFLGFVAKVNKGNLRYLRQINKESSDGVSCE
jgi:hypothetical protein